jgi:hypothetical protein
VEGDTTMTAITFSADRIVDEQPDVVWRLVQDHAAFAEIGGLALVEVISGEGTGLIRRCTNHRGDSWDETCTQHVEGRRYQMTVDVSTYPRLLRWTFRRFSGTWEVTAAEAGSKLRVMFEADTRLPPPLARLLRRSGTTQVERMLDRYLSASWSGGGT